MMDVDHIPAVNCFFLSAGCWCVGSGMWFERRLRNVDVDLCGACWIACVSLVRREENGE